ncbi:MAG: copper-binding protein [Hyphomicrobiaceae bacterium]|nr:MAG: copper-binding protein [Hyphomicrobiaceae bacterium]
MRVPVPAAAFAFALAMSLCVVAPLPAQITPEQKEICKEADGRYREMFGKPPREEGLIVVLMYKYTFCPPQLSVKKGSLLRFVNVDKRTTHSVWFKDDGRPESVRLFSGEHVDVPADLTAGTHTFICGPHWELEKMVGTLAVTP